MVYQLEEPLDVIAGLNWVGLDRAGVGTEGGDCQAGEKGVSAGAGEGGSQVGFRWVVSGGCCNYEV